MLVLICPEAGLPSVQQIAPSERRMVFGDDRGDLIEIPGWQRIERLPRARRP
jgi:hypothetical protein